MKQFLRLVMIGVVVSYCSVVSARNYYVATSGNDANSGTSTLLPWKTIGKVNAMIASFSAGDSILFKCGDTFTEQLTIAKSGTTVANIVFGNYEVGAKPIINTAVTVSNWATTTTTNIWVANYTGALSHIRYVTANDAIQPIGRFPNLTASNDGFLYHDESWGDSVLRDAALQSSVMNWTGATAVTYSTPYSIDICPIAKHNKDTLFLASNTFYDMYAGYGYFIQNHLSTLDTQGEWYLDTLAKKLYYYSTTNPSSLSIQASSTDHAIKINDRINYITINGLSFKNSDSTAISFKNSSNISITNCDFYNCLNGVRGDGCSSIVVSNNRFNYMHNNSVWFSNLNTAITCTVNTITNNAIISGLGAGGGSGSNNAISVLATNAVITKNTIERCGYIGIRIEGYGGLIAENRISYFNAKQFDGAGIYSFGTTSMVGSTRLYGTNIIEKNVIKNGIGYRTGTSSGDGINRQPAIYMDFYSLNNTIRQNVLHNTNGIILNDGSNGHKVINNTIYNSDSFNLAHPDIANIHVDVGTSSDTVSNNLLYNISNKPNLNPNLVITLDRRTVGGIDSILPFVTRKNSVTKNVYFSSQNYRHLPITASFTFGKYNNLFSQLDSNYYWQPFALDTFVASIVDSGYTRTKETSFGAFSWKNRYEPNSVFKLSDAEYPFSYGSVISNIITSNNAFTTNLSGWSVDSENATNAVTWVASGGLDAGCTMLDLTNANSNSATLSSARLSRSIGAVSAGFIYRLKFSMIANSSAGALNVYTNGANSTSKTYTTSTNRKEFIVPISFSNDVASNSIYFTIHTKGLKVYLDNIVLERVAITQTNPNDVVVFQVNDTSVAKQVNLGTKNYRDYLGNYYTGTITLQPYTSILLLQTATSPLPLQLVNFKGYAKNDHNELVWATNNEVNIRGFNVEASTDGQWYKKIAWIDAKGQTTNNYSFQDYTAINQTKYYRLAIQEDGMPTTYSNMVKLSSATSTADFLKVFPLPSKAGQPLQLQLYYHQATTAAITVFDNSGKKILQQNISLVNGVNNLQIIILKKGLHRVQIQTNKGDIFLKTAMVY